jgi:hypothetical protein
MRENDARVRGLPPLTLRHTPSIRAPDGGGPSAATVLSAAHSF